MAKKGNYRTRVESVQEEVNHANTGWGSNWDQGGWDQSGQDQNRWPTTPAHDSDVQPGDSISNASYTDTNADWTPAAPIPPPKEVPMQPAANDWGWAGPVSGQPMKSATEAHARTQSPDPVALGMKSMLSAIAEQRQAQLRELSEELKSQHQRAQDLPLAYRNRAQQHVQGQHGRHRREVSTSWGGQGGRGRTSDAGAAHPNHAAGESSWGTTWEAGGTVQQAGNTNHWGETGTASVTNTKSKKKRNKNGGQGSIANDNGNGWGTAGGRDSALPGEASTSVAPGGFGSTNDAWGALGANAPDTGGWENTDDTQAQSQGWGGWTEQDAQGGVLNGKIPKSGGLSGFFSRIFRGKGRKGKEKGKDTTTEKIVWGEETKKKAGKEKKKHVQIQEKGKKGKTLKKPKFAEPEATAWPSPEEDEDTVEDDNVNGWGVVDNDGAWGANANDDWGNPAPAGTSKPIDGWGDSSQIKSSKANTFVNDGHASETRRSQSEGHSTDIHFKESHGEALAPAQRAFYSPERLARDRIFWFFDPNNDARVSYVLGWIQRFHYQLATFGFGKFLESRERGALFSNAAHLTPASEPMFDWMTYNNIQPTYDRTLQESLAFYDPSSQILVFVFLPSQSKNSMAIWRRKLPLPENVRQTYGRQIKKVVGGLNKPYPIHVDEMPSHAPDNLNRSGSNKKKWLNWGRP